MKGILILLLAGAATPALAQNSGGATPATAPTTGTCTPEHAAMGHCELPTPTPPAADPHAGHSTPAQPAPAPVRAPAQIGAPAPAPAAVCLPEHAAMGHCKLPAGSPPPADPHDGHNMPAQQAPAAAPSAPRALPSTPAPAPSTCLPEHAAMGHCTLPAPSQAVTGSTAVQPMPAQPAPAPTSTCLPEHAAMGHCKLEPAPAPATTCLPEHAAMGHCTLTPTQPSGDPHAGHNMQAAGAAPPPPATPPPPEAFLGPENGADAFYGQAQMAEARGDMVREHGGMKTYRFLIDQLEARIGKGSDGYAWDAEAWYGGDINKLWVTTEGEGEFGGPVEGAEVQALWSRAIDPWFDVQLGVRQGFQSGPDRSYLVAGVQGLAPYWFEVEAMAFVSNKGEVSARFQGEYDLRLTQSLIFQPMVEFNLALQDSPEIRVGSGLSTAELGARLRYELFPKAGPASIAPYIGVQYERAFGDTARYYRASGEDAGGWKFLVGLRTWF